MNELVTEWVEKAEGDSRTAEREGAVSEGPNYDAVCFHAQQCAEKYLKAFLTSRSIPFPRLHDLEALLNLVTPVDPEFEAIREPLLLLNDYAVDIRYPGDFATAEEARDALQAMREVRAFIRQKLGLEVTA